MSRDNFAKTTSLIMHDYFYMGLTIKPRFELNILTPK